MVGKFDLPDAKRTATTGRAGPSEIKADQLPKCVQPEAPGHNRIAFEMAPEKPEVALYVELSLDNTLVVSTAGFRDIGNAIKHQHRWQRQLRVTGSEQLAPAAAQQFLA